MLAPHPEHTEWSPFQNLPDATGSANDDFLFTRCDAVLGCHHYPGYTRPREIGDYSLEYWDGIQSFFEWNRRIAVAVPIPSAFPILRQETPWFRSCHTCSGVTPTRGRPTGFFVAVSGGVIGTPQPSTPGGHRVHP